MSHAQLHGANWADAYCRTTYTVWLPAGAIDIRTAQVCPALDAFLVQRGLQTWAFISASNPRSNVLCEQENMARHENLLREVSALHFEYFDAEGRGDDATWPAEPSILIIGISAERARELGRNFEQNAVVFGERGAAPRLLWCEA